MFENVKVRGTHAARYIISWINMGGKLSWRAGHSDFNNWLRSLDLNDDEIHTIVEIARSGKLELEMSATDFIKNIKKPEKI